MDVPSPWPAYGYGFDQIGRISSLGSGLGGADWKYDAASRITSILFPANEALTTYAYDKAGQIVLLANLSDGAAGNTTFAYSYDPVGNRTQVVEGDGDVLTLTYDRTYQLTNEQRSGAHSYNITYVYDPVGNRTQLISSGAITTNTYDAGNQLLTGQNSAGLTTNTFDGSGNLLTSLAPGNLWTTNTWDGENRRVKVALPSGTVNTYAYNGDGHRVQRNDSTGSFNQVWDGENVLLETTSSTKIIQAAYALEPATYGRLLSKTTQPNNPGAVLFYMYDALGSTRQIVNGLSEAYSNFLYDSFGNNLLFSGTSGYAYVGRLGYYADPDSGSYHVRARDYDPAVGRFLSRDPIRPKDGLNKYAYVNNNPFLLVDPSGMQADEVSAVPTTADELYQELLLSLCSGQCGSEIGSRIEKTLSAVSNALSALRLKDRRVFDLGCIDPTSKIAPLGGWDICMADESPAPCGQGACSECFTVYGSKQWRWDINYALWGLLGRECGWSESRTVNWAVLYKTTFKYKEYSGLVDFWVQAGYNAPDRDFKLPDVLKRNTWWTDKDKYADCAPCSKAGAPSNKPFDFEWFTDWGPSPSPCSNRGK